MWKDKGSATKYYKEYGPKYRQKNKGREKERLKKYREENKEQIKEYQEKYDWENKERKKEYFQKRKEHFREYNFKRKYNLTLEQIDEILTSQDHKCLICGKSLIENKRCIDHNHETGEVRGILCIRCNTGLSYIENAKFLEASITYLKLSQ